jgi:ABC-2 type transport system ATP-binding protein
MRKTVGMEATIEIDGLRKRYGGTVALDEMSFAVEPGAVTGFAGPNGAGKSTTMRVLFGLDRADAGTALIGGRPYRALTRPMRHAGALLDPNALQPGRSGRNHLGWIAASQGVGPRRVDEVLDLVGLAAAGRRRAGGYSLGMRQRLGLAAAMLGDPPVLVLDEPFNGLDPEGIFWIRGLLRDLAAEGRAVLVASHLMGELQEMAARVLLVGHGRILAAADVGELAAGHGSLELAYLKLTRGVGGIR